MDVDLNGVRVPFFNFESVPESLKKEWTEVLGEIIDSGIFINGKEKGNFEIDWSKYLDIGYSIGVSNGMDGLEIALRSLNIGSGCKVLVPAHTFIATWNAVLSVGAEPIGIDVTPDGLIDLDKVEEVDEKFDAIIPVHMHGSMVDMERLMRFSRSRNVAVIEDASQAHGAKMKNGKSGTYGDVGVFSLYPTKNLGALGDAGIVSTGNRDLAERMRILSNYGSNPKEKYFHQTFGSNKRLDEFQAGILRINLKYLDQWNNRRQELASIYLNKLNWSYLSSFQSENAENIFHHFCLLTSERNKIRDYLHKHQIYTDIHYPKVAANEVEKFLNVKIKDYPIARFISQNILSLPISPWHTNQEILYVCEVLNRYFE